jgi:hypothetical protein
LYVRRVRSGTFHAVFVLLWVFPVMCVGSFFSSTLGARPMNAALLCVLALAAACYAFMVTDVNLTMDGAAVRLFEQNITFGVRGERKLTWELPMVELTSAREVTTRTPSSRGGWMYSTVLHFPGDKTLTDGALGGKSDPASEYNRLVAALRARLGDRFTTEDRV